MYKFLNILLLVLVFLFILSIFKFYYSSSKNVKIKDFNRLNINQILKEKTSDLPVLNNDTNNVVEFNDSFESNVNEKKERSFWNLLKK
tara:strand:- start:24 stop:287 length:264 start_codon:yes stop_codon:yes gene_type:complete